MWKLNKTIKDRLTYDANNNLKMEISLTYETEIYYIIIASWLNQLRIIDA